MHDCTSLSSKLLRLALRWDLEDMLKANVGARGWAATQGRPYGCVPVFTCGHLHSQWRAAGS